VNALLNLRETGSGSVQVVRVSSCERITKPSGNWLRIGTGGKLL
jgi:hypothetical protein